MTPNFYPPQLNPFLVRLAQFIAPCAARSFFRFELVVSPDCLAKMRSLQNQRLIILPNHPTFQDPIVMFVLSERLGQAFHYLAAYDLLQGSGRTHLVNKGGITDFIENNINYFAFIENSDVYI